MSLERESNIETWNAWIRSPLERRLKQPGNSSSRLEMEERINLSEPRWSQSTFLNRLRHFVRVTNPLHVFYTDKQLYEARDLVEAYKAKREPIGTTIEQLWAAQALVDSAFHPDTGELSNIIGRMSFQVYGGTVLCAAMMVFYKSTPAVLFWQWANQSFNAFVNYTNRNAHSPLTNSQVATAYLTATTGACTTAIALKNFCARRLSPTSVFQRLVPFAAVAAAHCLNVPLMRVRELQHGVMLTDQRKNKLCKSRLAAMKAISQVVVTRIALVTPCMLGIPFMMSALSRFNWFVRRKKLLDVPIQTLATAFILVPSVPIGCAMFPQRGSISREALERWDPQAYRELQEIYRAEEVDMPETFYFNKGL